MMEDKTLPIILLFSGLPRLVLLELSSGRLIEGERLDHLKARGNAGVKEGQNFALYAYQGRLVFQADARRWNFSEIRNDIQYFHDLDDKTTVFSVRDFEIRYPAWWRDTPSFDPIFPEFDEDEDYLGYIYALSQNPEYQPDLIAAWSA